MKLIGLCGKARSGKTEFVKAAQAAVKPFGEEALEYQFAGPLKKGLAMMTGLSMAAISGEDPEIDRDTTITRYGVTIRHMMQTLGTEWGRHMIDENIWVKRADVSYRAVNRLGVGTAPTLFIASDVRYRNEAEWVVQNGGSLIEIVRPEHGGIVLDYHSSEASVFSDLVSMTIFNSGSLAEFRRKVTDVVLEELK